MTTANIENVQKKWYVQIIKPKFKILTCVVLLGWVNMHVEGDMSRGIRQVEYDLGKYISLFFLSLRAGGILQILQSDWFRERAVFFTILPANPGGIVGSFIYRPLQVCLLFANEQNR